MIDAATPLSTLLRAAADDLDRSGVGEPGREAWQIWRAVAGDAGVLHPDRVDAGMVGQFRAAVARRAAGEPLAYAVGFTGFRYLHVATDRRGLIPRPETEGLVDVALARVRTGTAIDVGTGSGAIALALAQEGRFDRVIAVDRSPDALMLARENGSRVRVRVEWLRGDLLGCMRDASADLVVSNPPYLSSDEFAALDRSVAGYEPREALVSGDDGLEHTRRLLDAGRRVVRARGWIALEVDATRAAASAALAERAGWTAVTVTDDLFGRARYLLAQQGRGE